MPDHRRVLERAPHEQRRRNRAPVVGDRDAAGRGKVGDFSELFALRSRRDGANRIHARQAGFARALDDEFGDRGVIVDRIGVRHARDGGEPAGHGRRRAGRDRLLVLLPRLAQVHVDVDEARRHDERIRQRDDARAFRRQVAADRADLCPVDEQVESPVPAGGGVDDVNVLEQ